LISLADQVAALAGRQNGLRAYASAAEVSPSSAKIHRRLAQAFRDAGDFMAAAGHFRAAASLENTGDDWLSYLHCLAASRLFSLLRAEAQTLSGALSGVPGQKIEDILRAAQTGVLPAPEQDATRGELTVELKSVSAPGHGLDVAVYDPAGRRISGLWRRGASASGLTLGSRETLALGSLENGRYLVAVSRSDGRETGPAGGVVAIRVRDKRRDIPFTLEGSNAIVAEVRYRKVTVNFRE
jgi:hypothetical protein